jgi:hypothetical protein
MDHSPKELEQKAAKYRQLARQVALTMRGE